MAGTADHEDTLELINKEVSDRLGRLATSGSQVDTKSALLAGVAATATQFLATRPMPQPVLAALGFAAFGLAFAGAVAAYALTRHQDVPDPRRLAVGYAHRSKADTLAFLIATRVAIFKINHVKHRRKVVLWWISAAFLAAGLLFSTLALVQGSTP